MPGAPNSPPKPSNAPVPVPDGLGRKVLRRLAPSRVALRLDLWKGAPARDLLEPFESAEAAYGAGDFREAESALDRLSVRFAEPRWPTMPEPFRSLRVAIPAPMPPHYDPEFTLPPEEKDRRRGHREAEAQLALLRASLAWAGAHGVPVEDLAGPAARAESAFTDGGAGEPFWSEVDAVWAGLRDRVPAPPGPPRPAPSPPASGGAPAGAP